MAREVVEVIIPTDLDAIPDGTTRKAMTDTEKTKLTGVEENAAADQSGAEIKAAYQAEPNAFTDTKDTKLTGVEEGAEANIGEEFSAAEQTKLAGVAEGAEVNPADLAALDSDQNTKLNGIEAGADVNPTGAEMQTAIVGLPDTDRVLVGSEPQTGEKKIYGIHRNAAGNLELDAETVAES